MGKRGSETSRTLSGVSEHGKQSALKVRCETTVSPINRPAYYIGYRTHLGHSFCVMKETTKFNP